MAKRPTDVVGFFIPADRSTDFTGELTNPVTGEVYTPPSMTKQEFVAECDINNILREFTPQAMNALMAQTAALGGYANLPDSMDLQESMAIQQAADQAFSSLPSRVRDRFGNDPGRFLEFFHDPANEAEAKTMGLIQEPPPPPPPLEVVIKGGNLPAEPKTGGAGGTPPAEGAKAP